MKYWPRYIGDWKKKTSHLSLLEKGVYTELLDFCYATECGLPLEFDRILAVCGARSALEIRAVEKVLGAHFVKNGQEFFNPRAKEEIEKWKRKSTKAAESAKAKWSKSETGEP